MSSRIPRGNLRRAAVLALAMTIGGTLAPSAFAQEPSTSPSASEPAARSTSASPSPNPEPARKPDLSLEASVPDETYVVGDRVPVTATISNVGEAEATGISVAALGTSGLDFFGSKDLGEDTIAPGETRTVTLNGTLWGLDEAGSDPQLTVNVETSFDANPGNNTVSGLPLNVVPPSTTDTVGGIVYADKNANGAFDSGEGLSGVTLTLSDGRNSDETTTSAGGHFTFADVPVGVYTVRATGDVPGGWVINPVYGLRLDGSGSHPGLSLRGVHSPEGSLSAEIAFGKRGYEPGDTATLTVTLTNRGSNVLSSIEAGCNRSGEGPHLEDWHNRERWGDLVGDGVTIGAGQTKTFEVTGIVPESSVDYGAVLVACDFSPHGTGQPGIEAGAAAKVRTDRTGDPWGALFHDRNGDDRIDENELVGEVKVSLVDPETGKPVATTVADEAGLIEFTDVPVGPYWLKIHGPWQLVEADQAAIWVVASGRYDGWILEVEPAQGNPGGGGPIDPKPITDPPAEPDTRLDKTEIEELADTGVDATTMTLIGTAVLLAGIGAVLFTRRRRTTA